MCGKKWVRQVAGWRFLEMPNRAVGKEESVCLADPPSPYICVQIIAFMWLSLGLRCSVQFNASIQEALGGFSAVGCCQVSVLAFDQVGSKSLERSGVFTEGLERGKGICDQLFGVLEGTFDPEDRRPGGLDAGGIFSGGLAQFL